MRRREKFVLSAVVLSLLFLGVLLLPLGWRLPAVAVFTLITYVASSWALSDDLQRLERLTIVPFPTLFAAATGLFYTTLPEHWFSRVVIVALFGLGMYGIFLTCNIFSVAKGRTIQLLYAAHASLLFFSLLLSLFFANTIFSVKLLFPWTVLLIGATHFPIVLINVWSTRLQPKIAAAEWQLTLVLTVVLMEVALGLCFFPLSAWQQSLLVMAVLYMGLGIIQNYLRGRLFSRTLREYLLVAIFTIVIFILMVPAK